MQLDYISLFNKIVKEKSISKVANECHLSQPALSQQMKKVEDSIGMRLFERSNRGIELTEAGKLVHHYFLQMEELYSNLQEEVENLKKHSGTIRILASPVVGQYALPCTVHKMSEKFPKYHFSLSIMTSQEVMRKVQEGNGYIGFVVDQDETADISSLRIFTDHLHLVCSQKFFSGDTITMEELKKKPMITLVERFSPRRILEKALKDHGENLDDFNILMNLDSTESVKASVIANLGFAFLPYMAIKKELYLKQLKIVEIEDFKMDYPLNMVHKEGSDFQNVPQDVIRYFEKVVKETFC